MPSLRNFSLPMQCTLDAAAKTLTTLVFSVSQQQTNAALASSSKYFPGPDGISDSMLRQLAPALALPLAIIFQQSLAHCVFSAAWKTATEIPVYNELETPASSNRSISLCSTQLLEKLSNVISTNKE